MQRDKIIKMKWMVMKVEATHSRTMEICIMEEIKEVIMDKINTKTIENQCFSREAVLTWEEEVSSKASKKETLGLNNSTKKASSNKTNSKRTNSTQ